MFINENYTAIVKGLIGLIRNDISNYEINNITLGMLTTRQIDDEMIERLKVVESYLCKAHNLLKRM